MSAKPKKAETTASIKEPRVAAGPVASAVGINDVREDGAPVLGHFVDVISGEYEGRYGVFEEVSGETAVVRSRDNDSIRFSCQISDLRSSRAGKR